LSYIQQVLQPGETVRYQGSVSWVLYLAPIGLAVAGVIAAAFGPIGWIIAAICFAVAAILALRAWFIRWTTEIAVTNFRVIYAKASFSAARSKSIWTKSRA
jgi:hypothetical protein